MATETITMENIFDQDDLNDIPELHPVNRGAKQRGLEGEKNYQNYLVDKDGDEYDPYSLAWRYLGLYIDCNADNGGDDHDNHNNHRRLHEDEGGQCQRKLLWAAYVDRRYEGNTIEEYKFYDINTGDWDNSTCLASGEEHRCVKLNCHEPHTKFQGNSWELVGVFKETNGMYDWFEQLFKHEGTCIWNDNEVYGTMETWMEKFPTQCTKLSVSDEYGNTIYMSTTPLAEGNMTLGIYTDKNCMTLSEDMDYSSYIVKYYQSYYERSYYYYYSSYYNYFYNLGQEAVAKYTSAIVTWNEYMSNFKTCQPCKAYNLMWDQQNQNKHERKGRVLGNNDGDGEEQARYNCYDEAGYTNVNQCYKFQTKTSLAIAEPEDLEMASEQGSILLIKAYGKVYGEGGYVSDPDYDMQAIYISVAALSTFIVAMCACCIGICRQRARRCKTESITTSLTETDSDKKEKSSTGGWWSKSRIKKRKDIDKKRVKDAESGEYRSPSSDEASPSGKETPNEINAATTIGCWWNKLRTKKGGNVDTAIHKNAESGAYTPPSSVSSSEENPPSRTSIIDGKNNMVSQSPEAPTLLSTASDVAFSASNHNLTRIRSLPVQAPIHLEAPEPFIRDRSLPSSHLNHEMYVRKLRREKRGSC